MTKLYQQYTGDMCKMFNQVMIHRFLWRSNDTEQSRVYQRMRLNFGDKPTHDIAAGAIMTLAKASEAKYPAAAKELSTHLYVDDIRGSCEDKQGASELRVRSTPYLPQANSKSKHGILTTRTLTRQMKNLQISLVINGAKLTTRFTLRKTESLQM